MRSAAFKYLNSQDEIKYLDPIHDRVHCIFLKEINLDTIDFLLILKFFLLLITFKSCGHSIDRLISK